MNETITWVSVEERLPVELWQVLVCGEFELLPYTGIAYRINGKWIDMQDDRVDVTHWAELPKGPKGDL